MAYICVLPLFIMPGSKSQVLSHFLNSHSKLQKRTFIFECQAQLIINKWSTSKVVYNVVKTATAIKTTRAINAKRNTETERNFTVQYHRRVRIVPVHPLCYLYSVYT